MMSDVLLSARNLSVRFGGVLAVNNVSFDVRRGEVFTLIGPNGAALVLSFLATLYPAWRAARTQPAQALRYE